MKISLDALQVLDVIERHGSFTAAAAALHRVPSALSHAVAKFESDLGLALFIREGRRATLTPAGRTLLDDGRDLLRAADELERRVQRIATGWEAELRIALDMILPAECRWSICTSAMPSIWSTAIPSRCAQRFGISPLVVGLTIVAFGTSAPEVAVSVGAVLDGKTDIAIGNVVGSNIFNVLFILGISALIAPLVVNIQLIRQEVPIMLGASLLLLALSLDGRLSFLDGGFLFALLVAYTVFLVVQSRRETQAANDEFAEAVQPAEAGAWDSHWAAQIGLITAGLVALVIGSDYLVQASVSFAKTMGVSDLVIGLTIVAAGTSMPEVATSIAAAIKGERDIAVGNVVGSNTFNILGCLGLSGLVSGDLGLAMAPSLLAFDIWVMLAVALACLPVFMTGREIARWEGGVFLAYYVAYVAYLILAAQQHDALQVFSSVMMGFVVPLTVVTLVVVVIRRPSAAGEST